MLLWGFWVKRQWELVPHKPSSTPKGQGWRLGQSSVLCARCKGSWWCGIRFPREPPRQSQNGHEIKIWKTDCQDGRTAHLGIFNTGDSLWGLHLRGPKLIMPDFHNERQPRKRQWAQDQNCYLPAEARENLGTMLRSEASSPPWPRCHRMTFLPRCQAAR